MFTIEHEKGWGYHLFIDGERVETFTNKEDAEQFAKAATILAQAGEQSASDTVDQIIKGKKFLNYMENEIFKDR